MAVFRTENGKEMIVICGCAGGHGCGNSFRLRAERDEDGSWYIMTYMNNDWRRLMESRNIFQVIGRKLKKIWFIIRGKDYYYSDIVMDEIEFESFREYINGLQ